MVPVPVHVSSSPKMRLLRTGPAARADSELHRRRHLCLRKVTADGLSYLWDFRFTARAWRCWQRCELKIDLKFSSVRRSVAKVHTLPAVSMTENFLDSVRDARLR